MKPAGPTLAQTISETLAPYEGQPFSDEAMRALREALGKAMDTWLAANRLTAADRAKAEK